MKIFTLLILFLTTPLFAVTVEVLNLCEKTPLVSDEFDLSKPFNVGELTVALLEKNEIPFQGNEMGMNSINESPIGLNALEVISDAEMRAYGWCYGVDGIEPAAFPDKVILTNPNSHISWYFGFAHYKDGDWISQCEKTYEVKPSFICQ